MRKLTLSGLSAVMMIALLVGSFALPMGPAQVAEAQGTGAANWTTQFFNTVDLSGPVIVTRYDTNLDFTWDGSPVGGVNADNFSTRFTARVNFPQSGRWAFRVGVDDGVRLWIDVTQIINEWHGSPAGYSEYQVILEALTAGDHDLRLEFYDAGGPARIWLRWEYLGGSGGGGAAPTAVPEAAAPAAPAAPQPVIAAVTGNGVNVRTGPGRGYPVIRQINYPQNYVVLGGVPDLSWLLIDLKNGAQGWVSNDWVYLFSKDPAMNQDTTGGGQPDFVDIIPRIDIAVAPPAPLPSLEDSPRTILQGVATDTVNLRDGPSATAAQKIGSVPAGATFTVEARNGNGGWYLITYRGIRGWVNASYVRLTTGRVNQLVVSAEIVPAPPFGQEFFPADDQGQPLVTVRGRATDNLRMRDGATLFSSQIASVPKDTEFVVSARNASGAWYLITVDGVQGWVSALYVTLIEGRVPDLPIR